MSAREILEQIPGKLLEHVESQVSDIHLEELAMKIVRWEDLGAYLDLSEAEQEEIRRNNMNNYRAEKRAALHLWRQKNGMHATYRRLVVVFCLAKKADLACAIKDLLQSIDAESTSSVLETFRSYLVECYTEAHHPSQIGWPFSRTTAYVDLPLYEVPITDQTQDSLKESKRVELDKLFLTGNQKAKRKVVLLQGVAGSGKTTLSWHACQKWAEELLFQQFSLLIRVPLEDPAIHSASRIADIIPHPSKEFREAVEKAISEQRGKGVCFLFDGFDEAPPKLRRFVDSFLSGKSGRINLPRCNIVVTSRPVASGDLSRLVTSRIVLGRLDKASVDDMLSAYLSSAESESDDSDLQELSSIIEQSSLLANLCNLPINAAIVVYLFQCGRRKLPETRTGLFKAHVCNLLLRHIQLRTPHDLQEVGDDDDFEFEELPDDIFGTFRTLCSLAFKGIGHNSGVFSTSTLKREGLRFPFDSLSLMEAHATSFGRSRNFTFLHYSVQEFLAAWHMTKLGSGEQAKAVSDILSSSPLSPVLPFFAGLTGLSNIAAMDVLLDVAKYPLDPSSVLCSMPRTPSEDRRRLALALLNCIHETQDPSLCQLVEPPRDPAYASYVECNIAFSWLVLEPSDCLSIGFFMVHKRICEILLRHCDISHAGFESLFKNFKTSDSSSSDDIHLDLCDNVVVNRSMKFLGRNIINFSSLTSLVLGGTWLYNQAASNLALLIEGLYRRLSYIRLYLQGCGITSEHVHLLVLLIMCPCLTRLGLGYNDIGRRMRLIIAALAQNTSLHVVELEACNLQDESLMELGKVLKTHRTIMNVDVSKNNFSSRAIKFFLTYQFHSVLRLFDIGRALNEEEKSVYRQLCRIRSAHSIPSLAINRFHEENEKTRAIREWTEFFLPPDVRRRSEQQYGSKI